MTHPAACPYCGGEIVNQVQPDYLIRHARLNDDGSITVGETDSGGDFDGPMLLFCHSCSSTYAQPATATEHFDENLSVEYPPTPREGDPGYIGKDVRWLALSEDEAKAFVEWQRQRTVKLAKDLTTRGAVVRGEHVHTSMTLDLDVPLRLLPAIREKAREFDADNGVGEDNPLSVQDALAVVINQEGLDGLNLFERQDPGDALGGWCCAPVVGWGKP